MANDTENGDNGSYRGCVFCKSGMETEAAQQIELLFPQIKAIAPVKTRYRRMGGVANEEQVALLPGYVFFETGEELQPFQLRRNPAVLKLLTYDDGDWRLHGTDDLFARLLFEAKGQIGLSKAWFDEGDKIRVLEGFLKEYEGDIIRVNKRAKTAQVSIAFQDKHVTMWLGFELIEKANK